MKNILNLVLVQIIAAACSIHACALENALHQDKGGEKGVISARQWDVVDIRFEVDEVPNPVDVDFHVSIETDRNNMPNLPGHASTLERRFDACQKLRDAGHFTVVTVSPLLPIDDPDAFFARIAGIANAAVIDHFILGDGKRAGTRTLKTALPRSMAEVTPESVTLDYRDRMAEIARRHMPGRVGISAAGFAGIYA